MDSKKLIKRLVFLILFIFVFNFLANKFYWYYSLWYLDMLMHFLGGFWVALVVIFLDKNLQAGLNSKIFTIASVKVLFFVLIIGIGWEIFEVLVNDVIAKNPFDLLDTGSDIFFDLVGGTLGIFYFLKRIIMPIKEDAV